MAKPTTRRSRPSASDAYELLLAAIEDRTLPPGTRLREVELADRFKISRTPVREALKRLETQGFVAHEPHKGTCVASLDYGQIVDLYHMREVLEGTAAYLAALHATPIEIELLQELVELYRESIDDPAKRTQTNRQFHHQLQMAAHNRFLNLTLENIRRSLVLVRSTASFNGQYSPNPTSIKEHETIVEWIAARDAQGAEHAARVHVRNTFKRRIKLFTQTSE